MSAWTSERLAIAQEAYAGPGRIEDIAAALGTSRSRLIAMARRQGWGRRPRAKHRRHCWRRRTPAWEGARLEQIELAWRSQELTRQEIADRFAVSMGTLSRIARGHGWPPRRRGRRWPPLSAEALRRLKAARGAGLSRKDIADRFGISPAVQRALEAHEMERQP